MRLEGRKELEKQIKELEANRAEWIRRLKQAEEREKQPKKVHISKDGGFSIQIDGSVGAGSMIGEFNGRNSRGGVIGKGTAQLEPDLIRSNIKIHEREIEKLQKKLEEESKMAEEMVDYHGTQMTRKQVEEQQKFERYAHQCEEKAGIALGYTLLDELDSQKYLDSNDKHLGLDLAHMTYNKNWNVEFVSRSGAYISNENRTNLAYVPITKDQFGWNHFKRDEIKWNQNKKINLSMEKDEKGQYIKLESKDKGVTARAYLKGEAKPFQELKNEWEMEKRTFQKQKDRSQDKELSMER